MAPFLQIILSLSIAVITVFLVLLLIQARRTAQAVERLAESATRDLDQVAEDIREVRLRVESISDAVRHTLELPSALTQVVTGLVRALPGLISRRSGSGNLLDSLLTGFQTALHLFRNRQAKPAKESSHE